MQPEQGLLNGQYPFRAFLYRKIPSGAEEYKQIDLLVNLEK